MRSTAIPILQFSDYRAYLVAHAQQMKSRNDLWSMGAWARTLGLKSTSSLTKIVNGERHPGGRILNSLVSYFRFNKEEEEHFKDLIKLHRMKRDPEVCGLLLERLLKRPGIAYYEELDEATFSALSDWYCYAIREMVQLDDFLEDPHWISRRLRFRVSSIEARRAIEKLVASGLLKRNKKGRLVLGAPKISTQNDVLSQAIQNFHHQSLENGKHALTDISPAIREFTSTTFVFDPSKIEEAKAMIRDFRKRFAATFETPKGSQVYQFQMGFFPLTKEVESKKAKVMHDKNDNAQSVH